MAFGDDYRCVRKLISGLDQNATGGASTLTKSALESLTGMKRRYKSAIDDLRLADDEIKRVKDRLENERAEVDRLSEVVRSLREEVGRKPEKAEPEMVERAEVPAPDSRVIRSRIEKAYVDGYEEGFAQGFKEGAAYGKGNYAR